MQLTEAMKKLKAANIRVTPQRSAILDYLMTAHSHPTAEEIYQKLENAFPNMSLATVYNNLRLFVQLGFVKELSFGEGSSRFDFSSTEHYHVICEMCGKVTDFFYPGLDEINTFAENVTGYEVHKHQLELYGICENCQEKIAKKTS